MRLVSTAALAIALLAGCTRTIAAYPDEYAGVGLELSESDGGPRVLRPLPGSAAETAGLQEGDRVVAVDGVPTVGRPLADVVARLRGPAGSSVALVFERGSLRATVDLLRAPLERSADGYRTASTVEPATR